MLAGMRSFVSRLWRSWMSNKDLKQKFPQGKKETTREGTKQVSCGTHGQFLWGAEHGWGYILHPMGVCIYIS